MTLSSKLSSILTEIQTFRTPENVWECFYEQVRSLEIDALSYYHIPPVGAQDSNDKYFFAVGLGDGFTSEQRIHYNSHSSPLTSNSKSLVEPVFWPKARETLSLTDDQCAYFESKYCKTSKNGIIIPVFGPNSRNGIVVLRFENSQCHFGRDKVHFVNIVASQTHIQFCRIWVEQQSCDIVLTSREQEVLTWVARGKSNSVIADIVGISKHTVNGYLRRIYLKTRTSDRTTAALTGIGSCLIDY